MPIARRMLGAGLLAAMTTPLWRQALAAGLDPAAVLPVLPDNIPWSPVSPAGNQQAVMYGDPNGTGLYIVLNRWLPGQMSRPHYHANDRFITVLSGTWWCGSGRVFQPDETVPMPTGTFVTHFGRQVHYDGAKDAPCTLQILGMGPAASVPAEAPR